MEYVDNDREAKKAQAWHDAMRACQAEMTAISKDGSNPQTRSKYVTLGALDAALRPIYIKHGFDVTFGTLPTREAVNDAVTVTMCITHEAGHARRFNIEMPCDGQGIKGNTMMTSTHAVASAVSYGRRYLLTMGFNLATQDDDGNAAGGRPAQTNGFTRTLPAEDKVDKVQKEQLEGMAEEVGANQRMLCVYLSKKWNVEVKTMGDVPKSRFADVVEQLQLKKQSDNADKQKTL